MATIPASKERCVNGSHTASVNLRPYAKPKARKKRRGGPQRENSRARLLSASCPDMLHDFAVSDLNAEPLPFTRSFSDSFIIPATFGNKRASTFSISDSRNDVLKDFGRRFSSEMTLRSNRGSLASGEDVKRKPLASLEDIEEDSSEDEFYEGEEDAYEENESPNSATDAAVVSALFAGIVLSQLLANASLQKLNSVRPGCGQLITVFQYLATIIEKSTHAVEYVRAPVVPLKYHSVFVALMFLTAKLSNMSVESPCMPFSLYLVIKNSNLVFSLLLGRFFLKRKYAVLQVLSVVTVSVGVTVCVMLQDGGGRDHISCSERGQEVTLYTLLRGPTLCVASTLTIASLGIVQEYAFRQYHDVSDPSRGASESLFFMHFLGLPLFTLGGGISYMKDHAIGLAEALGGAGMAAALTLLNVVSMVLLKRCFVELLDRASCLTATMAITVSRTVGVVLSALPSTNRPGHSAMGKSFWAGAGTVACGSVGYVVGGAMAASDKRKGKVD